MLRGGAPAAAMARELTALQHEVGVSLTLAGFGPALAGLVPVDQLEARARPRGRTQQLRLRPSRRLVQGRGRRFDACVEALAELGRLAKQPLKAL